MTLILVTAPPAKPVTLDEVKAQVRIDTSDEDALLTALIGAAVARLDNANTGVLGRALVQQTWDVKLDRFCGNVRLPMPPLQSITSITYLDTNGDSQTLAPSIYQVVGIGDHNPGYVRPAFGQYWPAIYPVPEAITIRFVCGYAPDTASPPDYAANIPEPIKQAILLDIADLYRFRETVAMGQTSEVPMNGTSRALLAPYRVESFA